MKKALLLVVLIALGGGVYWKRASIEQVIAEWQKPHVAEVAYSDVGTIILENDQGGEVPTEVEEPSIDIGGATVPRQAEPAEEAPTDDQPTTTSSLPATFNLAVPFTSQAPKSNWDEVHEETCEEASVLMAAYYYQGKPAGKIDSDEAETALLNIVEFETSFFGFYKDTNAAQTAALLEAYFQLNGEVMVNPTIDEIKTALVAGHPVILPAAGRMLGNPNFTGEGPIYHNVLIKGYTAKGFIVNDPGTRLGADYFYTYDIIMNAMHDWNGGDVVNGDKVVIVVTP